MGVTRGYLHAESPLSVPLSFSLFPAWSSYVSLVAFPGGVFCVLVYRGLGTACICAFTEVASTLQEQGAVFCFFKGGRGSRLKGGNRVAGTKKDLVVLSPFGFFFLRLFFSVARAKDQSEIFNHGIRERERMGLGSCLLFSRGNFPPSVRSWFHFFCPT